MIYFRALLLVSVLCGISVFAFLPNAISVTLHYRGQPGPDLVRGLVITFALVSALALLLPHRVIPFLQRQAAISGRLPWVALAVLALLALLVTALLSQKVGIWPGLVFTAVFSALFISPGLIYRQAGQPVTAATRLQALSREEVMEIISENSARYPRYIVWPLACFFALPWLVAATAILHWQVIPEGWMAINGRWLGLLIGPISVAVPAFRLLSWIPPEARRGTWPKLIMVLLFAGAMAIYGFGSLFHTVIPKLAADYAGVAESRIARVLAVRKDYRKGCPAGAGVETDLIKLYLCSFYDSGLKDLVPGDSLRLTGRSTGFGFVIDEYRREN